MPSYTDDLARFLATTGPPVQSPMLSSPSRHRQLLSRLRTPGNKRKQVSPTIEATPKHIPLQVYYDPTIPLSVPPKSPLPQTPVEPRRQSCPERTNRHYNIVDERKQEEQVQASDSDNNNITKNPSLSSSLAHIAFPKPPNTIPCPFCAQLRTTTTADQGMQHELSSSQPAPTKRKRRLSCPAAIKYKPQNPPIQNLQQNLSSQEAKALFGLIEQLQSQLVQEQASRKALEQVLVMARRPSTTTTTHMMPFPP